MISEAYETLIDSEKRKKYDDSLIPDEEYFKIKIFGSFKIDLRLLFV